MPEPSLEENGRLERREGEALTSDLLALVEDLRRFPDDPAAPLPLDALSSASTSRLAQQSAAPPAGALLSSSSFSQSGATWAFAAGAAVGDDSRERSASDRTFGLVAGEGDGARGSAEAAAGIAHPQRSYSAREPRSGRGDRSMSPPGSRAPAGELPDEHASRSATLPLPGRRAAGPSAGEPPAGGAGGALVLRDSRSLAQSGRSQSRHSLGPLIESDSLGVAVGSSGDGTSSNGTSSGVSSANDSVRRAKHANGKSATASSAYEQEACGLSLLDPSHMPQIRGATGAAAAGAPGASGRSPQHQRDRMMQLFSRPNAGFGVGADGEGSQLPLHLSSTDARARESFSDVGVGYRFDTVDAERAPSETSSHELTLDELVERNLSATTSSLRAEHADRVRLQTPARRSELFSNTGGPLSSSTALSGAAGHGAFGGPNGTRIASSSSTVAASTTSAERPFGDYLGLGLGSGPRPVACCVGGALGAPPTPLASGAPTDTDALVMERARDGPSWTFLLKGMHSVYSVVLVSARVCLHLPSAVTAWLPSLLLNPMGPYCGPLCSLITRTFAHVVFDAFALRTI